MTDKPRKKPEDLRSQKWFGRQDRDGFAYRSWLKNKGIPHDQFDGRPVIGICNTWSELTPCNSHFRTIAEQVKRGVYEAGGFPLEFPVMSLGETLMRPTAMLFRNLASMDVEEAIRANPIDGVVLLMGCDKTTPALLMGAASVDLPTIGVSRRPDAQRQVARPDIGSGTHVWKHEREGARGRDQLQDFIEAESCMHRSAGHCMTMGTASTMASMVEALGMGLPATPPSRPSIRGATCWRAWPAGASSRWCTRTCAVEDPDARGLRERDPRQRRDRRLDQRGDPPDRDRRPHRRRADARGLGPARPRDALPRQPDALGQVPDGGLLLRRRPAGGDEARWAAGLHKGAMTVNGRTIWREHRRRARTSTRRDPPLEKPFKEKAGIAVLRGNLAPTARSSSPRRRRRS
jgi:L-arabonate dehydrase